MDAGNSDRAFVVGLALGAAVGALIVALLKPQGEPELGEYQAVRGLTLSAPDGAVAERAQQAARQALATVRAAAPGMGEV